MHFLLVVIRLAISLSGPQITKQPPHLFICPPLLQVSLDSRVREVVNQRIQDPTPHTFDEAQLQIYTLMHRDSYPRFLSSSVYRSLLRNGSCSSSLS